MKVHSIQPCFYGWAFRRRPFLSCYKQYRTPYFAHMLPCTWASMSVIYVPRSGIAKPKRHELVVLISSTKVSSAELSQCKLLLFHLSFPNPEVDSLEFLPIWSVKNAVSLLTEFAFPWLLVWFITFSYVYLPFVLLCKLPIHIPCSFSLLGCLFHVDFYEFVIHHEYSPVRFCFRWCKYFFSILSSVF